ncbi:MAG: hypothetical protein P4L66_03775 [Acetobacteraceae bacterium]|nr:hypothetical protein [Acetobacteraceae bacterium]
MTTHLASIRAIGIDRNPQPLARKKRPFRPAMAARPSALAKP